ncbi:MAG TPA: hypothetical protein VFD55_02140 [Candidatus Angelobacter sp.]|nr:hypothetical protein [Candidatus Angelobacter sp.]
MYPNDDKPLPPPDYLNQIAPQAPQKAGFFYKQKILIAILGVIVILAIIVMGSLILGGTKSTEKLAARLVATESITDGATSKIKSTQLRASNSELKIYLTNTIRDIEPILAKSNTNIKKLSKDATSAESSERMLATLEDARLNAIYDRTYAREMAYQLDTILTLMRQISSDTGNKELKSFLENAEKNLEPTQKQFADFDATNG